jgi:hypothetical protein
MLEMEGTPLLNCSNDTTKPATTIITIIITYRLLKQLCLLIQPYCNSKINIRGYIIFRKPRRSSMKAISGYMPAHSNFATAHANNTMYYTLSNTYSPLKALKGIL